MGVKGKRQWVAVVAAMVVAVGIYMAGNLLGRATDRAVESGSSTEAAGSGPSPAAEVEPAESEPAGSEPAGADDEDAGSTGDDSTVPVAVAQPITGPGQPPLAMTGKGPHGTLRTTGGEYAALTFDDGPDPRWTPEVLELLREHSVKATFCVVGQLAEEFPDLVREIVDDGHTMCNHTWNHDIGLGGRSRAAIRDDLERTNEAIRAAAPGARVSYYRQPGGAWTARVVGVAEDLGMSSLHWAVDPRDWARPGAGAISDTVSLGTDAGAIVLLHDGGGERRGTVQALGKFLPKLADRVQFEALPPGVDAPRRHGYELPLKPSQH